MMHHLRPQHWHSEAVTPKGFLFVIVVWGGAHAKERGEKTRRLYIISKECLFFLSVQAESNIFLLGMQR